MTSHGEPLAPDVAANLFEPFKRGRDAKPGSLGLGLYVVAQVARAHGATYEVKSSHEATAFTIRWPRVSALYNDYEDANLDWRKVNF